MSSSKLGMQMFHVKKLEATRKIVLGSQSPRRYELLSLIVPLENIVVCPPLNSAEPGFDGLRSFDAISAQVQNITKLKNNDVARQLSGKDYQCLITADTVVVASVDGHHQVLGKPDGDDWQDRVRDWFQRSLCGREHQVLSAVCMTTPSGRTQEFLTSTTVRFCAYDKKLVEWYITTAEPLGKAGGYGLQGVGSLFAEEVRGSLSNVIGLPLKETRLAMLNVANT